MSRKINYLNCLTILTPHFDLETKYVTLNQTQIQRIYLIDKKNKTTLFHEKINGKNGFDINIVFCEAIKKFCNYYQIDAYRFFILTGVQYLDILAMLRNDKNIVSNDSNSNSNDSNSNSNDSNIISNDNESNEAQVKIKPEIRGVKKGKDSYIDVEVKILTELCANLGYNWVQNEFVGIGNYKKLYVHTIYDILGKIIYNRAHTSNLTKDQYRTISFSIIRDAKQTSDFFNDVFLKFYDEESYPEFLKMSPNSKMLNRRSKTSFNLLLPENEKLRNMISNELIKKDLKEQKEEVVKEDTKILNEALDGIAEEIKEEALKSNVSILGDNIIPQTAACSAKSLILQKMVKKLQLLETNYTFEIIINGIGYYTNLFEVGCNFKEHPEYKDNFNPKTIYDFLMTLDEGITINDEKFYIPKKMLKSAIIKKCSNIVTDINNYIDKTKD